MNVGTSLPVDILVRGRLTERPGDRTVLDSTYMLLENDHSGALPGEEVGSNSTTSQADIPSFCKPKLSVHDAKIITDGLRRSVGYCQVYG